MVETYNGMPAGEVSGALWRKGSRSGGNGCVEIAALPDGGAAVRNSRDPHGPALIYNRAEMQALIHGVKNGEFDDLI